MVALVGPFPRGNRIFAGNTRGRIPEEDRMKGSRIRETGMTEDDRIASKLQIQVESQI
jgi:hypothetical protein